MTKPTNPNLNIPASFAESGVKAEFTNDKLTNGFDRINPDVFPGDVLNKFIDDHCKGLNYALAMAAYLDAFGLKSDGSIDLTQPQVGVTPTQNNHLATKQYVDNNANSGIPYSMLYGNVDANGNPSILYAPGSGTVEATWEQPVLSSNGVWGVDPFSVRVSSEQSPYEAYKACDNNTSTYASTNQSSPGTYDFATLIDLKVLSITYNWYGTYGGLIGVVQGSTDYNTWTDIVSFSNSIATSHTVNLPGSYYKAYRTKWTSWNGNVDLVSIQINAVKQVSVSTATNLFFNIGGSYPSLKLNYADKTKEELSSLATLTGLTTNGTFNIVKEKTLSTASTVPIPVINRDLFIDFSQGYIKDNYGLHAAYLLGSPVVTNGKLVCSSSNNTGCNTFVQILDNTMWCIQGKFSFSDAGRGLTIFSLGSLQYAGMTLNRGSNNKLNVCLSSANASFNIANGVEGSKIDWATIGEVYIRVRFTGTQYLVDWSLNGTNWTNDITVTSSVGIALTATTINFGFYGYNGASSNCFLGTMDDLQATIGNSTCVRKNQITQGKTFPLYPIDGDYHCLTATEMKTYKRISGAWVETQFVPLGKFFVSGGTIQSYSTNQFNQNGYNTINAIIPNYSKGINVTYPLVGNKYIAPYDGVYITSHSSTAAQAQRLIVNGVETSIGSGSNNSYPAYITHTIHLSKGDEIYWAFGYTTMWTSMFYPMKGAI